MSSGFRILATTYTFFLIYFKTVLLLQGSKGFLISNPAKLVRNVVVGSPGTGLFSKGLLACSGTYLTTFPSTITGVTTPIKVPLGPLARKFSLSILLHKSTLIICLANKNSLCHYMSGNWKSTKSKGFISAVNLSNLHTCNHLLA